MHLNDNGLVNQKNDILNNIDIFLLKGETDQALNLFIKFLCKFDPAKCENGYEIFINILALTRVWPEYKDNTNCIIIRTLAQRRLANYTNELVLA